MSNPYAPDETSAQIFAEKTWLQGALLSNVAYGVELTLFAICFYLLAQRINRSNYKKHIFLLAFISVIMILGTLFMACNAEFTQLAFVEDRNFPGGPGAYEEAMFWIPIDEVGNVAFVLSNWLMDLLLVWRCMVIYQGAVFFWVIMTFSSLMFVASFVLGLMFLIQTSASSPWGSGAVNFTLAYFTMSLALNIIVTIFIVARLLLYRRHITKVLGPGHVSHYTSIASMIVESASLYSVFSLLFLVPFALNNPLAQIFLQTMGQVQAVASLLIIFRVAQGKGWTAGTSTQVATSSETSSNAVKLSRLRFVSGDVSASDSIGLRSFKSTPTAVTEKTFASRHLVDGDAGVVVDLENAGQ